MSGVPVLLITANVGSIFEEPATMLKLWTEEFLSTVSRLDPKFIALHCQEVGGKNYEQSMRHVEDFVRLLMSSEELRLFDKVSVFLDEDFSSAQHFTALGNFYFVHESLKNVLLWDFKECKFVPVSGKEVHSGNIEAVTTKEKAKFPQDFFPECKWSRKGFLRTRWSISGTVFDLINIHLFHDASNFIAMETFPSVYSKTRRRALEHTLERFHNDQYPNAPYFLFGDFNFRTDTAGVVKKLTEDTQESKLSNKGNISKLQFHNKDDNLILTLGKKEFSHHDHRQVFSKDSGQWLREYDRELKDFDGRLFEFPIEFVPSYPFEEDVKQGTNYMQTRVPAWCDRILLSPTAKSLVQNISVPEAVEYGIIGQTTCMGDHKPVYLRAIIASDAGMINCCSTSPPFSQLCFQVPAHYRDRLSMLPGSNYVPLFTTTTTTTTDRSCCPSKLLHATPIVHDPYTPESMESPSPSAIGATEVQECESTVIIPPTTRKKPHAAVSPTLLKSKLELIVEIERRRKRLQRHFDHHKPEDNQWIKEKRQRCYSDLSWIQRPWIAGKSSKLCRKYSLNSRPNSHQPLQCPLIIPKIAIINPSNFQSNESSVNLQDDDYTASFRRLSVRKDATSGEGSSLELDISDDQQASEKIYSRAQDSGLDTLDVEDAFSRGGSLGLSSNETTSTLPLDNEDAQKRLEGDFENNRVLQAEISNLDAAALIKDKLISDNRHQISDSDSSRSSNSICRDDADSNISEKEMRLKPCRVTHHQYQKSIVNKHRCEKCCCCVVS